MQGGGWKWEKVEDKSPNLLGIIYDGFSRIKVDEVSCQRKILGIMG